MQLNNDKYLDLVAETMPREQIERLQESRILQLVPYAYKRSKLIREVWDRAGVKPEDIKSMADFKERVPFIDKDDIRRFRDEHNDPFGGLLCSGAPHLRGVGFTSGTTGDPTPVPRGERHQTITSLQRELWHIGMRPGDYLTYALFTFREGHHEDRWSDSGFRIMPFQHHPNEWMRMIEASKRFSPKVFYLLSTPLILSLEAMEKKGLVNPRKAFASYEGAVFGGEPLAPRLRAVVESWGLEIFEHSSLGDITTATECRAHDGMHTWEDMVLVEHLDPLGNAEAGDGERGELVVTSLMDDISPLIRYRTDDLIEFTRKPCSCGRTHGRMKPKGRKGDEMVIDGKSVLPMDILPIIQDQPETGAGLFQLIRKSREADTLSVRVGHDPEQLESSAEELRKRLVDLIHGQLQVPVDIELCDNEELLRLGPPHKIPRVTKQ